MPPSATRQPFQPLQLSLDEMVTAAAGSSEWRTDPITSRRMASRIGFGGGGLIRLQDLGPLAFLGGLFSVAKSLVDHIGEAGVVVEGWAESVYGPLFGTGAFDAANKGVGTYTTFLQVQNAEGSRWDRAQAMVDGWTALQNGMSPAMRANTPFARPVQDSGYDLGKEQRELTQAWSLPVSTKLAVDIRALPRDDPRRLSFMAVGGSTEEGACSRAVLATWPSPTNRMLRTQWYVGFQMYFGMALVVLEPFRGVRIGATQLRCDRHGYNLQTARLAEGHWNSAHDAVKHMLQDIARAMGVQSTAEVMNLFSPHLPQAAQTQFASAGGTRVGYVPDLLVYLQPPVLGEIKGVRPCKTQHWSPAQAAASFNEYACAVNRREALVNTELLNRADRLDQEFNGTPVGTVGPLGAAFRQYGDGQKCVTGLVFGAFGEVSGNVARLLRSLVKKGADTLYPQMAAASMGHCEASLLWQARRKLGAAMWTANADVVLHRMQYLGGEASRQRSQQHRARRHFFPGGDPAAATHAHRMAANGFDVGGDYRRYRRRTDATPAGAVPQAAHGSAG